MQESFCHLRALMAYASNDATNESSLYGAVSFILTLFCASAKVTTTKFKNLCLGSFPQKVLRKSRSGKMFRASDFTILVVQSTFNRQSTEGKINDMTPLIWEVKASPEMLTWFGERRSKERNLAEHFFQHIHQVVTQVTYAKAKFNKKPIYALLSIDVWFILLYFPGNPPSIVWNTGINGKPQLRAAEFPNLYKYIVVPPTRMFDEGCTAFSPAFLYALQLSVEDLIDVSVTPHPFFHAPEGTAEWISEEVCHIHFDPPLSINRHLCTVEEAMVECKARRKRATC